jgi:RES domain-containing protein
MEVFRLSSKKYSHQLIASGRAARWNRTNQMVIYTDSSRALSTLEMVVHKNIHSNMAYEMMVIEIKNKKNTIQKISLTELPKDWRELSGYSKLQEIGSDWYLTNQSLILEVPSVIIPQETNYIINTNHPDFTSKMIKVKAREKYFWDERLV